MPRAICYCLCSSCCHTFWCSFHSSRPSCFLRQGGVIGNFDFFFFNDVEYLCAHGDGFDIPGTVFATFQVRRPPPGQQTSAAAAAAAALLFLRL